MKTLCFLGNSREVLATFPEGIRRRAGHELFRLQQGRMPSDFKPMSEVGPGACEIRLRDASGAFRVLFVAKFADAVYVLHAFPKRTQKTSILDIQLAARRYRFIGDRT